MITVVKRTTAPAILRNRGATTTAAMKTAYDGDPSGYKAATASFDFDSSLYGAKSVKNALIQDQHDKCAFCEAKITHVAYGDVEHFRPKKGYRQDSADPLGKPGYYWLAYEWSNLFFACQICNQRHKKNDFPLVDPTTRAIDHHDDLTLEDPLFVRPDDTPEAHIGFFEDEVIGSTDAGRATVHGLGLNRAALRERRLETFKEVALLAESLAFIRTLTAPPPEVTALADRLVTQLNARLDKTSEYAGMIRALHAAKPIV